MAWTVSGYVEIKELGKGSWGRVVLAKHEIIGREVAIKYLAPLLVKDPEFVAAFRTEARILSEIEDPHIAKIYEYIEGPDGAAIVMELVDGVTLRQIIASNGPITPQSALLVLKGSLLGLAAAHQHGIVHRDYKPDNVLVDKAGQSKLADFGIAARAGQPGMPGGTPSYMAPEQWADAIATPSTDIYAATVTFFECLTGAPPYRSSSEDLPGTRKQHEEAAIPADILPEPVRGLVRRGLAKKAEHRPADAVTFLNELEAVAGAGYGRDWELDGRAALARRAALLLVLFPLAGVAASNSSMVTKTLIPSKALNVLYGGGLALAVAVGLGWYVTANDSVIPSGRPPAGASSLGPTPTNDPAVVVSPSPLPSSAAPQTPAAKASQPAPSVPSPPASTASSPTANSVLQVSVLQYDPDHPNYKAFCWLDPNGSCVKTTSPPGDSDHATTRAYVTVVTQTTAAFTLRLRYVRVASGGTELGKTITRTIQIPAGETRRELSVSTNLREIAVCGYGWIKLTVSANIPGATSQPVLLRIICK